MAVSPSVATNISHPEPDRKSGSAGMPRPISYAVFCLKKKACLALFDADLVVGIQDLGGAGLCCASSEIAAHGGLGLGGGGRTGPLRGCRAPAGGWRAGAAGGIAANGGLGMDVDVRTVPLREAGMVPAEIMTSESQERMLAIVEPGDLDEVLAVCRRWEVQATVVGTVTTGGKLRIVDGPGGEVLADAPAATLHHHAPRYPR